MRVESDGDAASVGELFSGNGEMAALMRSMDWSATPLGRVDAWPTSLRTALSICLLSRFPMAVCWGSSYVILYNDAYRPILGDKHPWAMGRPTFEVWEELAHIVRPMFEGVITTGEATWSDDLMLPMLRHRYLEEAYFTVSYSAIRGEGNRPAGILVTVTETTERFLAERRLRLVRELGEAAGSVRSIAEATERVGAVLSKHAADVPFSLLYTVDVARQEARLAAATGLAPGDRVSPIAIAVEEQRTGPWPIARVLETGELAVMEASEALGPLPGGIWPERPTQAVLLPIPRPAESRPMGVLVCGVNPRRALDERHLEFFHLVVGQIANAMANAITHEEIRKHAEALAEIDRAKTTFFSNVSHEFRTPLTLMLGPTEDLLAGVHGELDQAQRAQLELLRRNELRLHRLVNALLEFSRIEAGRVQAWFEPVDLAELTRQIASAFQSAVERAGLEFSVECPSIGQPIYVDPDMWEQIVLNLLSNAFKFTFDGRISVVLRCEDDDVKLEVSDTGIGIRSEDMPRLFERFHRIEGTRARTHEGSGIGLALVHELVRLHGGAISAKSVWGEGTTFTVTVPKGSAHLPKDRIGPKPSGESGPDRAATFVEEALRWLPGDPDASAPVPKASRHVEHERRPSPKGDLDARILVADDNADMRDYLRRILGEHWSVEAVPDGQAALQAVRRHPPDIIVTDVMMPLLDGFGLLREVRADPSSKAIPVLMLSARSGEESRAIGIEAGADDYLVKPFSARELVARVRTHLELARAQAALDRQWQEWMSILKQAPFAISLVRMPERRYEFVNDVHIKTTGRDLTGLTLDEAFGRSTAAELEALRRRQDEIFAADGTVFLPDFPWRAPDSTTRYFSAAARPWLAPDGTKRGIIGLSVDITDQVLARQRAQEINEQTQRSEAALRRALAVREEFLTVASHELRTPLTTLGLQAEALLRSIREAPRDDAPVERWARKAERLHAQAVRLEQLIEGMLDVAGLEGAGFRLQLEPCDLANVVSAVVERFRGESKQAHRLLRLRTEPVPGRWDQKRVDQIATQLLSNALKFGGDEPVEITVGVVDDRACIAVRDRGIGIAKEDHQRIFGRFERAAPSEHFGGLGVGLWIAGELARAMGGEVRVESRPGEGAKFVVALPRSR